MRRSNVVFDDLAREAPGGQILVSSPLKALVESSGEFVFDEGREIELKETSWHSSGVRGRTSST